MMKKYLFMLFLSAMLALALISSSDDSGNDASNDINKEGLWMLAHFHNQEIDVDKNEVVWEKEEYYDTNVSSENHYDGDRCFSM